MERPGTLQTIGDGIIAGRPHKKHVRKTKAERQREIAEATLKLVGQYGLQGTTVSRIAEAVGLSRGALYRHFANREAVLAAAMDLMSEQAVGWLDQSAGTDVFQRVLAMVDGHASWADKEFESFVRPIFAFIAGSAAENLTTQMSKRQRTVFEVFRALVEQGKREGSIRGDVESGDLAWGLLAFAWAEDIARLMGVEEAITSGASTRNLRRLLAAFAPAARATPAPRPTSASLEPPSSVSPIE